MMKTITISIDDAFYNKVKKMLTYIKLTGNLNMEFDETHRFLIAAIGGLNKGLKKITLNENGNITKVEV